MAMIPRRVLILSQPQDAHVPPIVEELQRRCVPVIWCDLHDFPESIELSASLVQHAQVPHNGWKGIMTLQLNGETVALEDIRSVWWRRPQRYHVATAPSTPGEREFIEREVFRGFVGVLSALPLSAQSLWVSDLHAIRRAEFKPLQLAMAHQVGLDVPETLITNDPVAAKAFYARLDGKVIIKPVAQGIIEGDNLPFIYTNLMPPEEQLSLEGVHILPHCFQEAIPKALELRVIVIGKRLFAAEIFSQHSERTQLDWRRYYPDLRYGIHQLPVEIEQKLFALVRAFGLQYASMDMIVTPEGRYVWLEANPNGQFGWVQREEPRLLLNEAMADLLENPEEYQLQ